MADKMVPDELRDKYGFETKALVDAIKSLM